MQEFKEEYSLMFSAGSCVFKQAQCTGINITISRFVSVLVFRAGGTVTGSNLFKSQQIFGLATWQLGWISLCCNLIYKIRRCLNICVMQPCGEWSVEVPDVHRSRSPLPWSNSDILWERFKRDTNKSLLLESSWTLFGFVRVNFLYFEASVSKVN